MIITKLVSIGFHNADDDNHGGKVTSQRKHINNAIALVNDVEMRYGKENVIETRILVNGDAQGRDAAQPTKRAIRETMRWFFNGNEPGDRLVLSVHAKSMDEVHMSKKRIQKYINLLPDGVTLFFIASNSLQMASALRYSLGGNIARCWNTVDTSDDPYFYQNFGPSVYDPSPSKQKWMDVSHGYFYVDGSVDDKLFREQPEMDEKKKEDEEEGVWITYDDLCKFNTLFDTWFDVTTVAYHDESMIQWKMVENMELPMMNSPADIYIMSSMPPPDVKTCEDWIEKKNDKSVFLASSKLVEYNDSIF